MINIQPFIIPKNDGFPFGGGHTRETDPTQRGWRSKWNGEVLVIARRTVKGAFTAMVLSDGRWDVAYYEDMTGLDVWQALKAHTNLHSDYYFQTNNFPGWMLEHIAWCEAGHLTRPANRQ